MSTSILFLCPHNAAKSVTAAAFMTRSAAAAGLAVEVDTAGTDPDAEVLPLVRQQLERDGHTVDSVPRLVTPDDLERADLVINIGCRRDLLVTDKPIVDWGIPNFSEVPSAAFSALAEHVDDLVAELLRSPHDPPTGSASAP